VPDNSNSSEEKPVQNSNGAKRNTKANPNAEYKKGDIISSGAYSKVYKCLTREGKFVAVKTFKVQSDLFLF